MSDTSSISEAGEWAQSRQENNTMTDSEVPYPYLYGRFVQVCNTVLSANCERIPYKQIISSAEKLFGDRAFSMIVYDGKPDNPVATYRVRFAKGQLHTVGQADESSVFGIKIGKDYMQKVVDNPQEYVDYPEKLDWDWLTNRLGIS
jgi:hypothetical protein